MANRCKTCGRKVIWFVYRSDTMDSWVPGDELLFPAEWVHKKTNGLHCPYTDNLIDPYDPTPPEAK